MTDRYEQLLAESSTEEADKILSLCGFESKEEYFEHEGEIVRECFLYLEEGKSDGQCAYLLRSSQEKAELPVNEGTLTCLELHELVGRNLSEEEVARILDVGQLEEKEEYTFAEVDSFLETHKIIESELDEEDVSSVNQVSSSPSPVLGNDKAEVVLNLINSLSEAETEKVVLQLSQRAAGQRHQIQQAYDRRFIAQFKQKVESGELSARIQQEIELSEGKEFDLMTKVEAWEENEAQQLKPVQSNPALPG